MGAREGQLQSLREAPVASAMLLGLLGEVGVRRPGDARIVQGDMKAGESLDGLAPRKCRMPRCGRNRN